MHTLRSFRIALILILWGLTGSPTLAQTWSFEPQVPQWGQSMRFTWEPATHPEATPPTSSEQSPQVFPPALPKVLIHATDGDGQSHWWSLQTHWEAAHAVADFQVPTGLAYLQVRTSDRPSHEFLAWRRVLDTEGRPARGAWEQHLWHDDPGQGDTALEKELALYPDNLSVYRQLWWLKSIVAREDFPDLATQQQIATLEQTDERSEEWLYALAIGRLLLGDHEASLALIRELAERFPRSTLLVPAFSDFQYKLLEVGLDSTLSQELRALQLAHLDRNPDVPEGGSMLLGLLHRPDEEPVPLALVEKVFAVWMASDPGHPLPHLGLAMAHRATGERLEQGLSHAVRAADLLLQDRLVDYGDFEDFLKEVYAPRVALEAAQLARELDRPTEALAFAKLAQSLETEKTPQAFDLEGSIWESLAELGRAESSYRLAWGLGSASAEAALTRLFEAREGTREGLTDYLASLNTSPGSAAVEDSTAAAQERTTAPDFSVETLEGKSYALSQLRGQVVVLNFWGTGCLPCRAEVPELNKLVQRFANRGVVFLAPTGDTAEGLEGFLQELPFEYEIVPESQGLFTEYEVQGIPVHIVIDRNGAVLARRTGASEDILEELDRVIARAL